MQKIEGSIPSRATKKQGTIIQWFRSPAFQVGHAGSIPASATKSRKCGVMGTSSIEAREQLVRFQPFPKG